MRFLLRPSSDSLARYRTLFARTGRQGASSARCSTWTPFCLFAFAEAAGAVSARGQHTTGVPPSALAHGRARKGGAAANSYRVERVRRTDIQCLSRQPSSGQVASSQKSFMKQARLTFRRRGVLQPGFETLGWAYSSGQL